MNKMDIFAQLANTPPEAQKKITGGRLKNFTDINPMWRLKRLTEVFGPCGVGWKYEIVDQRIIDGNGNEKSAFVDILLYYKHNGEWSDGIPGIGGSSFVSKEKDYFYTNDECFKMALTDAIGTACKALGMSCDIYFANDRTKYNAAPSTNPVDEAADVVVDFGYFAGKTIGEIWKTDVNAIKALRDDPTVPKHIKDAIATIQASQRKPA